MNTLTTWKSFPIDQSTPTKNKRRLSIKRWIPALSNKSGDVIKVNLKNRIQRQSSLSPNFIVENTKNSLGTNSINIEKLKIFKHNIKSKIYKLKFNSLNSNIQLPVEKEVLQENINENINETLQGELSCYDIFHTYPKDLEVLFDYSMKRKFSDNKLVKLTEFEKVSINKKITEFEPFQNLNYHDLNEVKERREQVEKFRYVSIDETERIFIKDKTLSIKESNKYQSDDDISIHSFLFNEENIKKTGLPINSEENNFIIESRGGEDEDGYYEDDNNSILPTPPIYITKKIVDQFNGFGSFDSLDLLKFSKLSDYENDSSSDEMSYNLEENLDHHNNSPLSNISEVPIKLVSGNISEGSIFSEEDVLSFTKLIDNNNKKCEDDLYLIVSNAMERCKYDQKTDSLLITMSKNQVFLDDDCNKNNNSVTDNYSPALTIDEKREANGYEKSNKPLTISNNFRESQLTYFYLKKYIPEFLEELKDSQSENLDYGYYKRIEGIKINDDKGYKTVQYMTTHYVENIQINSPIIDK